MPKKVNGSQATYQILTKSRMCILRSARKDQVCLKKYLRFHVSMRKD